MGPAGAVEQCWFGIAKDFVKQGHAVTHPETTALASFIQDASTPPEKGQHLPALSAGRLIEVHPNVEFAIIGPKRTARRRWWEMM